MIFFEVHDFWSQILCVLFPFCRPLYHAWVRICMYMTQTHVCSLMQTHTWYFVVDTVTAKLRAVPCVCVFIHARVCSYVCTCVRMRLYVFKCVFMSVQVCIHGCMCLSAYLCMIAYGFMYVCTGGMCVCIHVHVCIRANIHTQTRHACNHACVHA